MRYPLLTINTAKLTHNAGIIVELCRKHGISVVGVTKACCGIPEVARAFCEGGVDWIGDSRIRNITEFKAAGISRPFCQLRLPMLSEVEEVVRSADASLVSEIDTAKALSSEAARTGRKHKVILMADLGDLREGLLPKKILQSAKILASLPGITLHGLGVNFACYGGIAPTSEKLAELVDLAARIRSETGCELPVVSGGNSSSLFLFPDGIPAGVNQLRIGEAVLLGRETAYRQALPGAFTDAFTLHCEIIELQEKPSLPNGAVSITDAFGNVPVFEDKGIRKRAIAAVGRHDIIVDGLVPADPHAQILGASSDHLLVDVTDVERPLCVGDILQFELQYSALISGMMSSYVTKAIESSLQPALASTM